MALIQIIVLALIQGLTEFLPVSSSAHLILGSKAFGWPDQGLVFDVATHLGTLFAVLVYFRRELTEMARAWLAPVRNESDRRHRLLGVCLAAASVPALLVGFLAHDLVEFYLRDVRIIAWTTIGFGLLLWLADAVGPKNRNFGDIGLKSAMVIGVRAARLVLAGVVQSTVIS